MVQLLHHPEELEGDRGWALSRAIFLNDPERGSRPDPYVGTAYIGERASSPILPSLDSKQPNHFKVYHIKIFNTCAS